MAARAQAQQAPISFNRDIRPILADNCFACHGPDEKQRETKFHFDTREGAFAEAGHHRARQCGAEPADPARHGSTIPRSTCRRPTPGMR